MDSFSNPLLILGGGYTGKVIYRQALGLKQPLLISSRNPELHLQSIPKKDRLLFDLQKPETWDRFPEDGEAIWAFPAIPLNKVTAFIEKKGGRIRRLLVIGSTSAYSVDPKKTPMIIDEKSPIDSTNPRVEGEEFLRKTFGAIILRSAGIYGPGRNPLDWIRQNRLKNSQQYLNLIHVEDLAGICLEALQKGEPGEVYNISDGKPRRCSEIIQTAITRWNLSTPPLSSQPDQGKRISNRKIIQKLHYFFRYPNLYDALDEIEKNQPN